MRPPLTFLQPALLILCLPDVSSRPEPDAKSSVVTKLPRGGKSWQSSRRGSFGQNGPSNLQVKSSGGGQYKYTQNQNPSHPSILLNQLSPDKQVLFLEKFSLLNPAQQAFAYNQFFSTGPEVQNYAITQFIELDADLLVRSVQTELEKVAEAFPRELEIVLAGVKPQLKFNPDLIVSLPIGKVCHDQRWVDGAGVQTLYRDCESGFVYNINTNVHFKIKASTSSPPDVRDPITTASPSTVGPSITTTNSTSTRTTTTTTTTTTKTTTSTTGLPPVDPPDYGSGSDESTEDGGIPNVTTLIPEETTLRPSCIEKVQSTTASGECPGGPAEWLKCGNGDQCVPKCRW